MRRQDIKLLALARQGDIQARCEVGRRYLAGSDGFARHVSTGLEYLAHTAVAELPQTARIVAETLALDEILAAQQLPRLVRAASEGSALASLKLGAWLAMSEPRSDRGLAFVERSVEQDEEGAKLVLAALRHAPRREALITVLRRLGAAGLLDGERVALAAAQQALGKRDTDALGLALFVGSELASPASDELLTVAVRAIELAEEVGRPLGDLPAERIEALLDVKAVNGDATAAYALGRALCGIDCGALPATALAEGQNMRRGAALLLRAADGGCDAAWLHLYRIHADNRLSVANPQMARFFLEKAAARGQAEAQRRLGALILRRAASLHESEQAIGWLYEAAAQEDPYAQQLLQSLLLPLEGTEEEASAAIELVQRSDPWLAARLRIARDFGLTKLEALCVDPVDGERPWGLVVGKNPFISQIRLSAPRAIPAVSPRARDNLRQAAELFKQASVERHAIEGDLRRRSVAQRRMFARHGIDESVFFAVASSVTLDSFRLGPKWAFRAKQPLTLALAE